MGSQAGRALTCLVLAALAAAPSAHAQIRYGEQLPEVMSDERTVTRWAHPNERAAARRAPAHRARQVGRLRFYTEDRRPEVYVALRSHTDSRGQVWVKVRLPRRPNGRTGWVRRESLGPFNTVRTALRVDKRRLQAVLFRRGRKVWTARIGIGAPGSPTPSGVFYIRERLRPPRGSFYGPWAFGTSAYSRLTDWPGGGVVGIHGTTQPGLIPGRPSHGCIRLRNGDISRLARLMPIGTPVHVR
jgi:lipoprotein-anchoring transpeptidase ErfK/SrfK